MGGGQLVRNTGFMEAVDEAQELFRPDAGGAGLVKAMRPLAEPGYVIDNQKLSGLAGNDLPSLLADRGVDTVFLTGVATNLTVEQTARHGTDLGLTVYVVSDCVAAVSDEVHQASLANLALTTRGLITATEAAAAVGAPHKDVTQQGRNLLTASRSDSPSSRCNTITVATTDGGQVPNRGVPGRVGLPLCISCAGLEPVCTAPRRQDARQAG